jgi:hypothetical protein
VSILEKIHLDPHSILILTIHVVSDKTKIISAGTKIISAGICRIFHTSEENLIKLITKNSSVKVQTKIEQHKFKKTKSNRETVKGNDKNIVEFKQF